MGNSTAGLIIHTRKKQKTMKTLLVSLVLSTTALMTTTVRAQSAGPAPAGPAPSYRPERDRPDQKAVRKTLDDARAALDKRDLNAFGSYFVKSADLYYEVTPGLPDKDLAIAHGWNNMIKMLTGYMAANPTPNTLPYVMSDYRAQVNGNAAFLNADGYDMMTDGKKNPWRLFVVMEKQNGIWKIASLLVHNYGEGRLLDVK